MEETKQIICPDCGKYLMNTQKTCEECGAPVLLEGCYKLLKVLGQNVGITYLAEETKTSAKVIIKELSIKKIDKWKNEELFQRETAVLKQLNHPQIPGYLDSFSTGVGKKQVYYLVQEYIEGINLAEEMENRRYTEKEVLTVMMEVLKALEYLQDLRPPVIHRDIKPSNLIRRPGGPVALIDFGAVKDMFGNTFSGDTVAGTFGFMAPEQFRGEAAPSSDFYSLGVVAAVLLSRTQPERMTQGMGGTINWRPYVKVSRPVNDLLNRFLAENPVYRPQSAAAARAVVTKAREELDKPPAKVIIKKPPPPRRQTSYNSLTEKAGTMHSRPEKHETGGANVAKETSKAVVGMFVVLGIVAGIAWLTTINKSGGTREKAVANSVETGYYEENEDTGCSGSDCLPVPMGLLGLRFHMTYEEVIAALPEAAEVEKQTMPVITPGSYLLRLENREEHVFTPPGFFLSATTTIGSFSCEGQFFFAVDDTLSRVHLSLLPLKTREAHEMVENALLKGFLKKYGHAHGTKNDNSDNMFLTGNNINREWKWYGEESNLIITSNYKSLFSGYMLEINKDLKDLMPDTSEIFIDNALKLHNSLIEKYQSEVDEKAGDAKEKLRQEREFKELEELKNLRESLRTLEDDI